MRGASFSDHLREVRAAFRNHDSPDGRDNIYGLRVARTCD
jgi:formylglycine-generating enzyme required for sulfatase activity